MEGDASPHSTVAVVSASSASKLLANLPSRGLFSSTAISSNPGGMRVYICDHETSPPENQHIKTNQQNILIRSLILKKQKGDFGPNNGTESSRKRSSEKAQDGKVSAKRANNQNNCRQEGSSSQSLPRDFQGLTVERLRALLKAKGLSPKGKKYVDLNLQDELIARLKSTNC